MTKATKVVWSAAATAAAVLVFSSSAYAQATANSTLTVSATVSARAKLSLGTGSITFADADPDTTPTLTASAVSVDVKARTSSTGSVTLTVLASGDLTAAPSGTIPIGNLSWTVSGAGFAAGTANKTTAQSVGTWTGSGNHPGSQTYSLVNSWAYNTGNYGVSLNYTLTAP
jgi:hypothetical protein